MSSHHTPAAASGPLGSESKPRSFRSKNGCNTCKRRKVRCNEKRPRCGHCERLNLECTWDKIHAARRDESEAMGMRSVPGVKHSSDASLTLYRDMTDELGFPHLGAAGFSPTDSNPWDEAMLLSPTTWLSEIPGGMLEPWPGVLCAQASDNGSISAPGPEHSVVVSGQGIETFIEPLQHDSSPLHGQELSDTAAQDDLVEIFLRMLMPPILVPVETGPKWASTRAFFASMARESSLVRNSIKTFAAVQVQRKELAMTNFPWQALYERAHNELANALGQYTQVSHGQDLGLKHILVSMFLLIYTDLLTKTIPRAHSNLRDAHALIHKIDKKALSMHERRLISWIRLLDARAVSTAGGEGLFLGDDDESLVDASPAAAPPKHEGYPDVDIEEILFDVLYNPGLIFYQKVQSFVGRITRIDPWHRTRGTVEDETEVMATAEQISMDLTALYRQRPALMDLCVAGNLTEKHLAKDLAVALTRSFRTYLANYYSSYIHLHRVAYVQYPKTEAVKMAIENIKSLSHSMADTHEDLPVNLLWPLMMWGCEEEDNSERQWILDSIRSLESIATNAKVTADLLEEVQRRQDHAQKRVDVRKVSHECFAGYHFAIV